jgi:hypothetical protein
MSALFVQLDERGIDYLTSELRFANQLGQLVSANVDLTDGIVFAVTPSEGGRDPYEFKSAIFPRTPTARTPIPGGYIEAVPSTEEDVAVWVNRELRASARRAFVCESYLLRARSLGRASLLPQRTIPSAEFVYHLAVHGDPPEDIADTVRMVYPVPLGFGTVCSPSIDLSTFGRDQPFDAQSLLAIAKSTEGILVGAYDGESVVIWLSKTSSLVVADAQVRGGE